MRTSDRAPADSSQQVQREAAQPRSPSNQPVDDGPTTIINWVPHNSSPEVNTKTCESCPTVGSIITNEEWEKFVKATGYLTIGERTPTKEEFPDAPPENLVAGSTVFTPTKEPGERLV